jgi:hypothetical protein
MFENLNDQVRGILVGTVCAILFTPLVARYLKRRFPPSSATEAVSKEVRHKCAKLSGQATYAGLLTVALPATLLGVADEVTPLGAYMLLGLLFLGPTLWIGGRLALRGSPTLPEYARFFEQRYHVNFVKIAAFSVVCSLVGLGLLVMEFLGRR